MNYRKLGDIPFEVSEIGLGTAQLANLEGNFHGVKKVNRLEAENIVNVAVDRGVNFFDTADSYGAAEGLLGSLDKNKKHRLFIATKAGLRKEGLRDFSESYLRSCVDRSLKALDIDTLDLFQLNKPDLDDLKDDRLFTLFDSLKKEGKIRYAGVVVGLESTADIAIKSGSVDCLQVMYNLLYPKTESIIKSAAENRIGVIVRSPLNSGVLSGAYSMKTKFPSNDERSTYFSGKQFSQRMSALQNIQEEIAVTDENLLEFSMKYILSNPYVNVAIPGASSVEQASRYISCSDGRKFRGAEISKINEITSRHLITVSGDFQILTDS